MIQYFFMNLYKEHYKLLTTYNSILSREVLGQCDSTRV